MNNCFRKQADTCSGSDVLLFLFSADGLSIPLSRFELPTGVGSSSMFLNFVQDNVQRMVKLEQSSIEGHIQESGIQQKNLHI